MPETVLTGTAVQEVADLARGAEAPYREKIGSYEFAASFRPLTRIDLDPNMPQALLFYTLTALAQYLGAEPAAKGALVFVESPIRVMALSPLTGSDNHLRRAFAGVECKTAELEGFKFNDYGSLEGLNIALQTCFAPGTGDVENLRKFCASVKSTRSIGTADDGVSQTVEAKRGIAAIQTSAVQNPWSLAPYRTFSEVEQPLSPFVLRFSETEGNPLAALFETGDQRWQNEAVKNIATFLRTLLPGWTVLG